MTRLASLLICGTLALSMTACKTTTPPAGDSGGSASSSASGSESAAPSEAGNAAVIEMKFPTYLAGENVGAKFFLPQLDRFNQLHEGKYKIVIEEIPQASYADKIKQLAQQNKLPALLHAPGSGGIDVQWFRTVAVPNGMAFDLTAFFDANPELAKTLIPESRAYSTEDGKLVCLPQTVIRPCGIYYNSKLYPAAEKPIRDMSMTEFIASVGDNKIAFQTVDNGWTTGLFLTGLIVEEEGGADLLLNNVSDKLYDYNHPAIVTAIGKLQTVMQQNGASNSIGAAYADAANAFMSENAAFICNGPWMAGEFTPESADKWSNDFNGADARADLLPGNVGVVNPAEYGGFWLSANASDDEREVALAFLAFRLSDAEQEAFMLAEGGSAPFIETSANFTTELANTQVLADLDAAVSDNTRFIPNILEVFPSSIADVEFGKLLPKLADGTLTAEQFCAQLTEKAEAIRD